MKRLVWILLITAAVLFGLFTLATATRTGQDFLLPRMVNAIMRQAPDAPPPGGLRVFMCGTSSPLAAENRAQACVAVMADERLYIVDAGAGSAGVATLGGLPMQNLQAILLTHFHSDHIAAIGDFNLNSWVAGRPQPLEIVGPEGVTRIVAGLNELYALDAGYRVAHHGAEMLPPELHELTARTIEPGVVIDEDGLTVRAFTVDHSPVAPAVGYRFDYGGRSVVISGDTIATQGLIDAARSADLLLADVISLPIIQALEHGARAAGRDRQAHILQDIQSYHASAASLAEVASSSGVRQLALYHLVPAPRNILMERIMERELPEDSILTNDGMIFDLPTGSTAIIAR